MQAIAKALSTPHPASLTEAKPLPSTAVAELFRSLNAQLGVKLADLFEGVPEVDVQAEWATRLAGFKRHELKRGLSAMSDRRFPPTLGEFKVMCRPALEPEFAWLEAAEGLSARSRGLKGVWTHPAVYRAALVMTHEIRTETYGRHRVRWQRTLSASFADGWGDPVPEPVLALGHSEAPKGPPAPEVRERIAAILGRRAKA